MLNLMPCLRQLKHKNTPLKNGKGDRRLSPFSISRPPLFIIYTNLQGGIDMDKEKQKKINRRNRKRGGAFEKRVADFLGFDVVPYSGSNARFGYGDVRNEEWLIECKNITPDGDKITIK